MGKQVPFGMDSKISIVICQDIPEIMWNAFRLANMMLEGRRIS